MPWKRYTAKRCAILLPSQNKWFTIKVFQFAGKINTTAAVAGAWPIKAKPSMYKSGKNSVWAMTSILQEK
jgi:hypothetical protein